MNISNQINELLNLKRQSVSKGGINISSFFRENYDDFEKLISFYKQHRIYSKTAGETAFGEIRKLLIANGIVSGDKAITLNSVGVYMSRLRAERKSKPVAVKVIDKPVATTATIRQPVTLTPVQKPAVVVPGVEPIEVTNWITELTRLEKEKNSPWNGKDQWMWNHFEGIAKRMGGSFPKDFMSVEKSMNDPIKTECMDLLLAKKH